MAVVWLVLLVICISVQTQKKLKVNEPLRGELESMVYSYMYNNKEKKLSGLNLSSSYFLNFDKKNILNKKQFERK